MAMSAGADALKDEIAPTGNLRVAIGISPAGGAYWSTKTKRAVMPGFRWNSARRWRRSSGSPWNTLRTRIPARSSTPYRKAPGTSPSCRRIRNGKPGCGSGRLEVTDATYIVKAGSPATDFKSLDRPGVKVAAVNNTTTMRGAIEHLKNAKVTGYQTYDEIFALLRSGEVDAFRAVARPAQRHGEANSGNAGAG